LSILLEVEVQQRQQSEKLWIVFRVVQNPDLNSECQSVDCAGKPLGRFPDRKIETVNLLDVAIAPIESKAIMPW